MFILRENEKIIKVVRQHKSVMAGTVAWSVILAGLVLFVTFRLRLVPDYSFELVSGVVLAVFLAILYKIYIWRKNTLVITNQRLLINIRQSLFSVTVTELLHRDIHDISFKQAGITALINRYGKLIIKTPLGSEIIFDKVPSPAKVVQTINEARAVL